MQCYVIMSENLFQEFSSPYGQMVRFQFSVFEFVPMVHLGLITVSDVENLPNDIQFF